MEHIFEFVVVGGAILVSMGLAMWMEWYCLRWLMRLMPGTSLATQVGGAAELRDAEDAAEEAGAGDAAPEEESAKAA